MNAVVVTLFLLFCATIVARDILELESTNLELTITAYRYLAILFYDESPQGETLLKVWNETAHRIPEDLPDNSELGKIYGNNPELEELKTAYKINVPSIQIVRNGMIHNYRGSLNSDELASFISKDSQPSLEKISSLKQLKSIIKNLNETVVFGLFHENDISDDSEFGGNSYSIDNWGQFSAVADTLRGMARFVVLTSPELHKKFSLAKKELPAVFIMTKEEEGFVKYTGEIIEMSLSEWILRNSSPVMGELTLSTSEGEVYASHFFSSHKLKFILFLSPDMLEDTNALAYWQQTATHFQSKAIFSYLTHAGVADVVEYFDIDMDSDVPIIAGHIPAGDTKYKSSTISLSSPQDMMDFVQGVMNGKISKILKSEPMPKKNTKGKGPVIKAIAHTVLSLVSQPNKDVLLAVYSSHFIPSKRLLPTYDLLGKAVEAETRISIVKIDAAFNDIPSSWAIKGYPVLLWFPAKDKPYYAEEIPFPRPYWDAGVSLPELTTFIQRESSFDVKSLRIATIEQLGSLMAEEDTVRLKYEEEDRARLRNEGRTVYEMEIVDWFLGEVAFDGKRWHVGIAIIVLVSWMGMLLYILLELADQKTVRIKKID